MSPPPMAGRMGCGRSGGMVWHLRDRTAPNGTGRRDGSPEDNVNSAAGRRRAASRGRGRATTVAAAAVACGDAARVVVHRRHHPREGGSPRCLVHAPARVNVGNGGGGCTTLQMVHEYGTVQCLQRYIREQGSRGTHGDNENKTALTGATATPALTPARHLYRSCPCQPLTDGVVTPPRATTSATGGTHTDR